MGKPRVWAAWECGGKGGREKASVTEAADTVALEPGGVVVVVIISDGQRGVSTWTRPSHSAGSEGLWTPRWDLRQ